MDESKKFNIRVYGLFINENKEILLSDEFQLNMKMTKFPGGGLEFGEGTIDALIREIREELNAEIKDIRHFYTTDFFQPGYFINNIQVISIYYLADFCNPDTIKTSNKAFDFNELKNGNQSFRWKRIDKIKTEEITFPIDQKVLTLLKKYI